jgi:hypothetical protein
MRAGIGKSHYLQSLVWVRRPGERWLAFNVAIKLARLGPIELKFSSENPVLQGVARSGTTEWHPYRSSVRINATNAEPRISWLRPSSINRAHIRTRPGSTRGRPNPILRRLPRRHILVGTGDHSCFGEYQYALPFFGASLVLLAFSITLSPRQLWETRSLFSCFSVLRALVGCP